MSGDDSDGGPEYDIDFRKHPEEYEVGRGEEGVFKVEPYKSELLPLWEYADREAATEAAESIHERFREYREDGDFVGMDMARKYLQMGYTRAMRYAKYPGGKKYDDGTERDPEQWADVAVRVTDEDGNEVPATGLSLFASRVPLGTKIVFHEGHGFSVGDCLRVAVEPTTEPVRLG